MTDQVDEPFAEENWLRDLTSLIADFELDQFAGIDAEALAAHASIVMSSFADLVKNRDRGMPAAIGAMERSELAVLRRVNKLLETMIASREEVIAQREREVENLNILLRDAYAQRDRARSEAALYALKEIADHG